jgi:hypothetical protein
MGGITSLASSAMQALGAANALIGVVDSYQNISGNRQYDLQKQQNDLAMRNAAEQAALQKEQIRLSAEQAETNRRSSLRRAMARQRALFGSSGTGSGGGSAQAVLLGMFDESEEDLQQRQALDALKTAAVDQGFSQQQRINTLQLSQLRERDRLKNVGAMLGSAKYLGGIIF